MNTAHTELTAVQTANIAHSKSQVIFEDRTPAHADHVGFGPDRMTTAAVRLRWMERWTEIDR